MKVLVTGGNKGIGFGIAQRLIESQRVSHIIITARSEAKAATAITTLRSQYDSAPELEYITLDMLSSSSMEQLVVALKERGHVLDAVVHNAGVMFRGGVVNKEVVDITMNTNYFGPQSLTDLLIKHKRIASNGRLVFVSSGLGKLARFKNQPEILETLSQYKSGDLSVGQLNEIARLYSERVLSLSKGKKWPQSVYAVSKLLLTVYTYLLAREHGWCRSYSCCPGWCKTDLTEGSKAEKLPYDGADTPVYLTLEAIPEQLNGEFFEERNVSSI